MNIGLIGCGRVGTTIFHVLRKKHNIVGVYDINKKQEKKAISLLGLKQKVTLETLGKKSTAVFIATPDDVILDAYRSLVPFLGGRTYIFHFSGALPSTIFPKKKGIYRGAAHPFATFPRLIIPPKRRQFLLYIEGDALACSAAKRIFQGRSFSVRTVSKKNKIYCHLAGVFASNFVVALIIDTLKVMEHAGMPSKDLHRTIVPIIKDTLANVEEHGAFNALSGPLQRGDVETIKNHLHALHRDPLLYKTYCTLSLGILQTLPGSKNKKTLRKILQEKPINH